MPLREDILNSIPGENPSGANLAYSPVYGEIKEARRQELGGPQGEWEREIKQADYPEVIRLAQDVLATQSKDLQLAVWLAEALIYEQGLPGLSEGLNLLRGLTETFWDTLYPELEDGDSEYRAAPLEWFGNYYDPGKGSSPALAVRRIPITRSGIDYLEYRQTKSIPTEEEAKAGGKKWEDRQAAQEEGKLLPEAFAIAFKETPKPFYRELEAGLKAATEALDALDAVCKEKFGDYAPGFRELRKALEEVGAAIRVLLLDKLKMDPDPVPAAEESAAASAEDAGLFTDTGDTGEAAPLEAGEITQLGSKQDAVRVLIAAAQYMRRAAPTDPAGYLIVRALRWGELRSDNGIPVGLLDAPSSETRLALKNAAAAGQWNRVLDIAENAAARTCGRGWLDLHRYAVCACDQLGYTVVARALRSGMKALLADLPKLPSLTLSDDTGTANPETLKWLIQEGLYSPEQDVEQGVEQANGE